MKYIILIILFATNLNHVNAQDISKPDSTKKIQTVEASCGQCQFGLKGEGCKLAVRIDGKAYFVKGTDIDSHGDAHGKDGFCEAIRKAEVQGAVVNNEFVLTYFRLQDTK
ncbi:MAG: hypothetical protein IPP38_14170 [Bacteroidetes bacterium]|nr:hypothetical protein [Bacteroidota bacterium]